MLRWPVLAERLERASILEFVPAKQCHVGHSAGSEVSGKHTHYKVCEVADLILEHQTNQGDASRGTHGQFQDHLEAFFSRYGPVGISHLL